MASLGAGLVPAAPALVVTARPGLGGLAQSTGAQAGVLPRESTLSAHAVMVVNGSGRPIRNVISTIWTDHPSFAAAPSRLNFANRIGEFVDAVLGSAATVEQLVTTENTDRLKVLRAHRRGALVFPFNTNDYLNPKFTVMVRFTDDAGLHWQIDGDLRLTKLERRADWQATWLAREPQARRLISAPRRLRWLGRSRQSRRLHVRP